MTGRAVQLGTFIPASRVSVRSFPVRPQQRTHCSIQFLPSAAPGFVFCSGGRSDASDIQNAPAALLESLGASVYLRKAREFHSDVENII